MGWDEALNEIELLLKQIKESGAMLVLKDGKLLFTAPPGYSPERKAAVLTRLRAGKAGLIAYLEQVSSASPDGGVREPRQGSEKSLSAVFAVQELQQGSEKSQSTALAACSSPHCAGCYEVAPGVKLHPPKGAYHYEERW